MYRLSGFVPLCLMAVLVVSCGEEESNDEVVTTLTPWESDVAAVEAILAANGYTDIPASRVAAYEPSADGEQRYVSLVLVDANGVVDIDTIPADIAALTELTTLNVSGNMLSSLPPEIGSLTKLRYIYASGNELASLPSQLWQLDSLQRLELDSNQLTVLPDGVGDVEKLWALHVSYNQLTTLPSSLMSLDSLVDLQITGNRICSLPQDMETWITEPPISLESNWQEQTHQDCP